MRGLTYLMLIINVLHTRDLQKKRNLCLCEIYFCPQNIILYINENLIMLQLQQV